MSMRALENHSIEVEIEKLTRRAAIGVFSLVLLGLTGCQSHYEWHQKLTMVVDTPDGPVSGSSVIEVRARFGKLPLSDLEVWYTVIGEATVVEVAPGRYLFALLGGSQHRYYRAVREQFQGMPRGEWLKRIPQMEGVVTLKPDNYPQLVTFGDLDDPKSVRSADPKNLGATFGPGYRFNKITLEITGERVTKRRIEHVLQWLGAHPEARLGPATGRTTNIPLYSLLSHGEFIRRE